MRANTATTGEEPAQNCLFTDTQSDASDTAYKSPIRELKTLYFNHPKNYLAVPLAVEAPRDTAGLISTCATQASGKAIKGAEALDLITRDREPTSLGSEAINHAVSQGSLKRELQSFSDLKGSHKRFSEIAPSYWVDFVQQTLTQFGPANAVLSLLQASVSQGTEITLTQLTGEAIKFDHPAKDVLLRSPDDFSKETVFEAQQYSLLQPDAYNAQAVYQLKTLLFHSGILRHRGKHTTALSPEQDIWCFDEEYSNEGEF